MRGAGVLEALERARARSPTMNSVTPGISGAALRRPPAPTPGEAMNTFASQSLTMYSTSPAVSLDERQV